jgi:hypothetical protein
MIDNYIAGSASQLVERSRTLIALIPRDLPRMYDGLSQRCRQEINHSLAALRLILDDPKLQKPENRAMRLRAFKRVVADLDFVEATGVAALSRAHADDHRLNGLVGRIATEIKYPLPAPICTGLSRDYFSINLHLSLLFVPLAEAHFMLHLPDLFHELAHPLLGTEDDPLIEPFRNKFAEAMAICLEGIRDELNRLERGRNPEGMKIAAHAWEGSWVRGWLAEFFCDLFAIYTAGPAFAWSHLHLALKRGVDPFKVPVYAASSHPADDARMRAMLHGLDLMGLNNASQRISSSWAACLTALNTHRGADYDRCFQDELLLRLAQLALEGTRSIGIAIYDPQQSSSIAAALNQAWELFWDGPQAFVLREKELLEAVLTPKGSAVSM